MKLQIALILLLVICSASALSPDFESARMLVAANLTARAIASGSPDYLRANISLMPLDDQRQQLGSLTPFPASYYWAKPRGEITFGYSSSVLSSNEPTEVTGKVAFPFANESIYTMPGKNIDSDSPGIIQLASSIAEGQDDLFIVEAKLAEWTNRNIEYNLSTLNLPVTKNASWVLANKQGVCAELTTLFIALNRALGIQARYVSGIAFTDSQLFKSSWGAHAWAEVYFPGYGWVPYDVTYGTYGFIDATHIAFLKSSEAENKAISYEWAGGDINTEPISLSGDVLQNIGRVQPTVSISVAAQEGQVAIGSYDLVIVSVKNNAGYYQTLALNAARTESLTLIGLSERQMILKPHETWQEYFLFKVSDGLSPDYIYTFPVSFFAGNLSASTSFRAESGAEYFDINQFKVPEQELTNPKPSVSLSCSPTKNYFYPYEQIKLNCSVWNNGNEYLKLKACLDLCSSLELGINQRAWLSFNTSQKEPKVIVSSEHASDIAIVHPPLLSLPTVEINADAPQELRYNSGFKVTLVVNSSSQLKGTISLSRGKKTISSPASSGQEIMIDAKADDFTEGNNTIKAMFYYNDLNGRQYSAEEDVIISMASPSIIERIIMFVRSLLG